MTQLQLESVEYKKMIIGDVNNYIAITTDGKVKCKGRFEFDELPLRRFPPVRTYRPIPGA